LRERTVSLENQFQNQFGEWWLGVFVVVTQMLAMAEDSVPNSVGDTPGIGLAALGSC